MSAPTLTIVTTVYDRAECLKNCLRSTANLTFLDWEQIVVADCPPPEVLAALERVVADAADPRITFHNLADRSNDFGITPAEAGLRLARGKYVAFLDDDNVYLANHFDMLVPCLESEPALGFVYSACLFRGERILASPMPSEGEIDLGQVVFRRTAMGDSIPRAGYAWDWHLIHGIISRGARYRFLDQRTFLFRLEPHRPFEADARLVEAQIKAREDESAAVLLRHDLVELQRDRESVRAERDALRTERDERSAEQSSLTSTLAATRTANSNTEAALAAAEREIESLRASLSWRMTAPLRRILGCLLTLMGSR